VSLAEARAIALENGCFRELYFVGALEGQVQAPRRDHSVRVLASLIPGSEGIVVTGIRPVMRRDQLERNLNQMLLNIENAYWNLHGSYWQLYTREQALRFAYETWKVVGAKYKAGRASLADFAQAQGQYELFRSQRLQAVDTALDNDRQLRAILGLPIDNSIRLIPSDTPSLVEKHPDWQKGLAEAMNRPELRMARADVQAARLNVLFIKNVLAPILQAFASPYDADAIGKQLDGTEWKNTARHPVSNNFNEGVVSCRVVPPTCSPEACVRQAELQLARASLVLQDQELKAERFLGLYYRRMSSSYAQIQAARAQREAFATQLRLRSEYYRAGKPDTPLDLLLEAQRFWADALATECQAIVTYNNALCGWEYAKGTIQTHAHVTLAEEAPAGCDQVRAVSYERQRTRQKIRCEQGVLANTPLTVAGGASLPALWKNFPPLREAATLSPLKDDSARNAKRTEVAPVEWQVSDIFRHDRKCAKPNADR
jgi:hypothetical protein